jgi:type VI secretion system secreted protein VgrG
MFLPRIGWEVLVSFLEGDIDQPVCMGSVYNASQTPPYPLPANKTMSTLKSASSPGGGGFNEIRFEDKKDAEQIFIHAQKNLDERIREDRYQLVGRDAHLIVKQDHITQVTNERHTKIGADDVTEVVADQHLKVTGKQAIEIGASHSLTVKGDVIEVFRGNHSEQTSQNYYVKAMGVVIEAMSGITLKCGGNSVVIDPSGVTLKGISLTLDGTMVRIASGPGSPAMSGSAGSAVSPIAPKEPFEADEADPGKMIDAKASQHQNQTGKYGAARIVPFKRDATQTSETNPEKTYIEIELVDEAGSPVPGEQYEVTLADGTTVARGTLDQNGFARIDGIDPGSCKVTFPRLDKDAWEPA